MENNIEMIENILNTERRNRRGNREIRFEVNSNYYEAVSKLLSDYKRVLKENEELKEDRDKFKKALGKRITYCNELEKDLFENCSNYVIPIQKVKDKIKEEKMPLTIVGGIRNKKILEYGISLGRMQVLQELLEGRKENEI